MPVGTVTVQLHCGHGSCKQPARTSRTYCMKRFYPESRSAMCHRAARQSDFAPSKNNNGGGESWLKGGGAGGVHACAHPRKVPAESVRAEDVRPFLCQNLNWLVTRWKYFLTHGSFLRAISCCQLLTNLTNWPEAGVPISSGPCTFHGPASAAWPWCLCRARPSSLSHRRFWHRVPLSGCSQGTGRTLLMFAQAGFPLQVGQHPKNRTTAFVPRGCW